MADQADDAAEVLSQDTTHVFDAGEARVLEPLIDEAFRPKRNGAGNRAVGSRDYLEAHGELRTSIATLLGTTVNKPAARVCAGFGPRPPRSWTSGVWHGTRHAAALVNLGHRVTLMEAPQRFSGSQHQLKDPQEDQAAAA